MGGRPAVILIHKPLPWRPTSGGGASSNTDDEQFPLEAATRRHPWIANGASEQPATHRWKKRWRRRKILTQGFFYTGVGDRAFEVQDETPKQLFYATVCIKHKVSVRQYRDNNQRYLIENVILTLSDYK